MLGSLAAACGDDSANGSPDLATSSDAAFTPDAATEPDAAIPIKPVSELLAGVPAGTAWADVSADIKAGLRANADKDLAAFRAAWGAAGLAAKEAVLLGTPDTATLDNFDAYVAAAFASEVPNTFKAHTEITNAALLKSFKKLYLDFFATRRVGVQYLADLKDWNGGALHEVALGDAQTIADQKAYAKAALAEMAAIPSGSLSELELALREKATFYFRQLVVGSSGFAYGSDDLLTSYGIASWAADLPFRYDASGGKIFVDDNAFLQITNAYFWGDLIRINTGTVQGLDFVLSNSTDPDYVKGLIGDPATVAASKDFSLLAGWFGERVKTHPDATKLCTIYSASDRDDLWNGFTADSLADNERVTSFETFAASYASTKTTQLASNKALTVAAIQYVFPDTAILSVAQRNQVIAAVNAETVPGKTLDTAYAAMDNALGTTAASDAFKTKYGMLTIIGGYANTTDPLRQADIDAINTMWGQVKSYLSAHYSGHTRDLASLVPATLSVKNASGGTVTGPDGNITVNLKTGFDKLTMYTTLMHEAKHAIDFKAGVPVEGAAVEGSARSVEDQVVPKLIQEVMGADPQLPLYQLKSALTYTRPAATTDATLRIYLRPSCNAGEPDSVTFAGNVAAEWGVPAAQFPTVSYRAHYGLQYLGYEYGRIAMNLTIAYLQAQLPGGAPAVDPYLFQACAINSPKQNLATVNALKTCLGL